MKNFLLRYEGYSHTYWVTGHSRGGALANLVAAKLIDRGESVFAYTFAAPGTTTCSICEDNNEGECMESSTCPAHAAKYNSIFNIINEDDFIPHFPLSQWYFTLYGRSTQNVSIKDRYATLWENSWRDHQGVMPETEYMHMNSPTKPFDLFSIAANTRNSCYEYLIDGEGMAQLGTYPSSTEGYYLINGLACYQTPMFLFKYFAAVATGEISGGEFLALDVAPYLTQAKWEMLCQITGLTSFTEISAVLDLGDMSRLTHPHLPLSYCLIATQITQAAFK